MKYPGLPAAGDPSGGPGWREAGTDLPAAAAILRRRAKTPAVMVMLAEVLRRQAFNDEAREHLTEVGDLPAVWLATGNTHWAQGNAAMAREPYERALEAWTARGDSEGILAARTGLARCARLNYTSSADVTLTDAIESSSGVRDRHLLADLRRECAAWAFLRGDAELALEHAEAAREIHSSIGDRYLVGLADVLRARAFNAQLERSTAVELMRRQVEVALAIGSQDLKLTAAAYLGQFMQRGVSPDTPEWSESEAVLLDALDESEDAFTRAELLLPLAHLYTASGQLEQAEELLDEYQRLYESLGGNKIAEANVLKARTRLELARVGGLSLRAIGRAPGAAKQLLKARRGFRRAEKAYREAGLEQGAQSVQWHISLVDLLGARRTPGAMLLPSTGKDHLDRARDALYRAEFARHVGKLRDAGQSYATAEEEAVLANATMFAVAAAAGQADIASMTGQTTDVSRHVRSLVDHAEAIRAAVVVGSARRHVATVLRSHYERALLMVARHNDGRLAIELAERLRTERLAGLLHRRVDRLPEDLVALLTELDQVNEALLVREPGVRGVRLTAEALRGEDGITLAARRDRLHRQLAERTTTLFAETYGAQPFAMEQLTRIDAEILVVIPTTADGTDSIVTIWRELDGTCHAHVTEVGADLAGLRAAVLDPGARLARVNLTEHDLLPLRAVLPVRLRDHLIAAPQRLFIVPTGWLWGIPFAAVPLQSGDSPALVLVDRVDFALIPSLRFAVAAARPRSASSRSAVSWHDTGSDFEAPELSGLDAHPGGHTSVDDSQIRRALVHGGDQWRTAVVAAHGNREPGLAHAILSGGRSVMRAADFLDGDAKPPALVSLASCHSGFPDGEDQYEPLGLAVAALTAGARQVISAQIEIDDEAGPMIECLQQLYAGIATEDDAAAVLCEVLRTTRSRHRHVLLPLYQWAALTVLGTA